MSSRRYASRIRRRHTPHRAEDLGSKRWSLTPSPAMVVASLALFLVLGDTVVRAHGGDPHAIHACVNNTSGAVRLTSDPTTFGDPDTRCDPVAEHGLDWSVAGPAGPQGSAGPAGAAGTTGAAGPQGPPGVGTGVEAYQAGAQRSDLAAASQKVVGVLKLKSGGTYVASAKMAVAQEPDLDAACALQSNGTGPQDYAVAETPRGQILGSTHLAQVQDANRKTYEHMLHLQSIFTLPGGTGLRAPRIWVKCLNLASRTDAAPPKDRILSVELVRIQALKIRGVVRGPAAGEDRAR